MSEGDAGRRATLEMKMLEALEAVLDDCADRGNESHLSPHVGALVRAALKRAWREHAEAALKDASKV